MTSEKETRTSFEDLLVFHKLAQSLNSSFDLDTILRTILEHMERLLQTELWTLLMVDEERQDLYYALAAGGEEEALHDLRVKVGEGVAGWVVQHGETLIVPEADDDPRARDEYANKRQTVRSVIALPLRGRRGDPWRDRDFQYAAGTNDGLRHHLPAHPGGSRGHCD